MSNEELADELETQVRFAESGSAKLVFISTAAAKQILAALRATPDLAAVAEVSAPSWNIPYLHIVRLVEIGSIPVGTKLYALPASPAKRGDE